jgi:hypothetical protein
LIGSRSFVQGSERSISTRGTFFGEFLGAFEGGWETESCRFTGMNLRRGEFIGFFLWGGENSLAHSDSLYTLVTFFLSDLGENISFLTLRLLFWRL